MNHLPPWPLVAAFMAVIVVWIAPAVIVAITYARYHRVDDLGVGEEIHALTEQYRRGWTDGFSAAVEMIESPPLDGRLPHHHAKL